MRTVDLRLGNLKFVGSLRVDWVPVKGDIIIWHGDRNSDAEVTYEVSHAVFEKVKFYRRGDESECDVTIIVNRVYL